MIPSEQLQQCIFSDGIISKNISTGGGQMKKYIIALILLLICCSVIIAFSVPDRVQYAFSGMAGYNIDKYDTHKTELQKRQIDIDFSTYQKKPFTVCSYNKEVYMDLDSIVFNGDSYTFKFISYGDSSFSLGNIICFEENNEDLYITNSLGEFVFQLKGADAIENDTIVYYFDLYPNFENCNINDLTTMNISILVDNMAVVTYERK